MAGCEVQPRCLSSERSARVSRSHMFMLGLIVTYHTTLTSCVEETSVCKSISSKYQHCRTDSAGVHDLDCFAKVSNSKIKCVWKPGEHASQKTYTLVTRQLYNIPSVAPREFCKTESNITNVNEKQITILSTENMTAEIFEIDESLNCTKAVFRGLANNWVRCGPAYNMSFWRHAGNLDVSLSWPQEDRNMITNYAVRYKTLESQSWSEWLVCQNGKRCTVENLSPSLVYHVQIQCVINNKCKQCPWSETSIVPPELTTQPDFDLVQDSDIANKEGQRLLFLTWTFSAKAPFDGYSVTVAKASGEAPRERINTTKPEVTLVLSYSAFHVSISVFNNVSKSPAVNKTIPERQAVPGVMGARLNVTVHSDTSFTVHWKNTLVKSCVCYCVEWSKKGHKVLYKSFFEGKENYKKISISPERLEPHERYTITLHTRPNKETCNLKRVNDGERTYGSTQVYFMQGTPIRAPANIIIYNVTTDSAVLEWSPIPEEDARGFLLGYSIHYMENSHRETEKNVTVDPDLNHYKLDNLTTGTTYEVQISGFTQAGGGVRSRSYLFKTNQGYLNSNLLGIITIFGVFFAVVLFVPIIIKRTKVIVWPSIPNPVNSNATKPIEGTCEREILDSINTLKVEEWDTNSLQIVEKETVMAEDSLPQVYASEDEGSAPHWFQTDSEDAPAGGIPPDALSDMPQSSPFTYTSGYTTMEVFNQMMPQCVQVNTDVMEAEKSDLTVVKSRLDYIRQLSCSPTTDSELSTFL